MTSKLEQVAWAIYAEADKQDYVSDYGFHHGDTCLDGHFDLSAFARVAIEAHLSALKAEGYVIVPRVPTEPDRPEIKITPEMIDAGVSECLLFDPRDPPRSMVQAVFRAMFAASAFRTP